MSGEGKGEGEGEGEGYTFSNRPECTGNSADPNSPGLFQAMFHHSGDYQTKG